MSRTKQQPKTVNPAAPLANGLTCEVLTLGEAATIQQLKTFEAYLRRKFDNERIRVVARPRKTDSAEVFIGEEYIGVLFFDEKDARSSYFELPILALDLDEPGLLKG